jgi:hypothetical protein
VQTRITQSVYHTVLKTKNDIEDKTRVKDDQNSLRKDVDEDVQNFVFMTRKQLNDIENDENVFINNVDETDHRCLNQVALRKLKNFLKMIRFYVIQNM